MFHSVDEVIAGLETQKYICNKNVATVVYLGTTLQKPILVEGPAGVGKTELGKVLAGALDMELIRLQCYEGLDEAKALYEWEYAKQLLYTQILKDKIGEVLQGADVLAFERAEPDVHAVPVAGVARVPKDETDLVEHGRPEPDAHSPR